MTMLYATRIRVARELGGSTHLVLLDAKGAPFAIAVLDWDGHLDITDQMNEICESVMTEETGPAQRGGPPVFEGHA